MLNFELKEQYIPAGTVHDYKDKYGENFGEILVASLSYQKIRAVMYVSSIQGKIFSVVENFLFGGGQVLESEMTMSPCAIERQLHRLLRNSGFEGFNLRRCEISCGDRPYTEKEREQIQNDVYYELLDKTSDAFPIFVHIFQNEWADKGSVNDLYVSVFLDKKRVANDTFFDVVKSIVFEHVHKY